MEPRPNLLSSSLSSLLSLSLATLLSTSDFSDPDSESELESSAELEDFGDKVGLGTES